MNASSYFGLTLITLALIMGGLMIYFDYPGDEEKWIISKSLFKTEQAVACYQGCKYTTQPIYNNTIGNMSERIKQYDFCVDLCEERYRK